ncbi:MAG: HAMP domain-containing protein [Candidatus Nitronauta litoralis]|uniref:histidine kinase n=1 Tax=Candidatus Nitronauta litoralis TaxID=2705533 RepID=A0A7T0BUV4_9BACT|nr:MAG: HAMP domain-containing protein [Candidatus Nitronauta litoralis]
MLKNKVKFSGFLSDLPIKTKILLSILSVLFLVMITFITLTLDSNRKLVLQVSKSEIINFTHLSAEALGYGLSNLNLEYIRNIINRMKNEPRLSSLLILDNQSNVIAGLNQEGLQNISVKELLNQKEPLVKNEEICWAVPIKGYDPETLKEKILGSFVVEFSLKSIYERILNEQIRFFLIAAGVMLFGIAVSILLARQISNPIAQLVKISRQVGETGDYQLRAEKKTGGEMGMLVDHYNKMLSQIEKQNISILNSKESLAIKVRERTQDLEKAKEVAENANRAKTDFLSRMSHELRTPLNAILGFSQLLKMRGWNVQTDIREQNEKSIDHIFAAGNHLHSLINEVLTLSQIESGGCILNLEPVDMVLLAHETETMLQPMAQKYNVTLDCGNLPHNHLVIKADPKRIRQVLNNLISNAIKFNRPSGKVEIRIKTDEENQLTLIVRDTGMGVPGDKAETIFEPFERLDWEFSKIEGMGIGLSISKNLIEAMGGRIGFESEVGIGTTFYFTMPLYFGETSDKETSAY